MTDNSYNDWYSMSDKALTITLGAYVRHHRLEQNKTQEQLAKAAGISRSTLSLLERGEIVTLATFIQILRVLEQLHVMDVFRIKSQISPLRLAKLEKKKRERARNKSKQEDTELDW